MSGSDSNEARFNTAEAAYLASACLEAERSASPREILYRSALSDRALVTERAVHKAIEERVVSHSGTSVLVVVSMGAVLYLACAKRIDEVTLSRKKKKDLYNALKGLSRADLDRWKLELAPSLYFEPVPWLRVCYELLGTYAEDRERFVTVDPDVKGGAPTVSGTRIPVHSVLSRIEGGDSIEDWVRDYPEIPREAFEAAVFYAKTHPRRGRPRLFR